MKSFSQRVISLILSIYILLLLEMQCTIFFATKLCCMYLLRTPDVELPAMSCLSWSDKGDSVAKAPR